MLENLETHELLTLMAITRRLKHSGISATTIKEIQQNYRLVCEEYNEDPRSSMSLRKYVDRLEQLQIIGKVTGPIRGSKGRRSRITIYDAPASVLLERVLLLLEARIRSRVTLLFNANIFVYFEMNIIWIIIDIPSTNYRF